MGVPFATKLNGHDISGGDREVITGSLNMIDNDLGPSAWFGKRSALGWIQRRKVKSIIRVNEIFLS